MSRIEVGRFSDLLRRFLEQKGQEEIASELSPEISGVFILESDRPDWLFLKGERLCCLSTSQVSGATAGPTFRLRNPTGSGMLATIQAVAWSTSISGNIAFTLTISENDLAGGAVALFIRDTRELDSLGINKSALSGSFNTTIAPVGDQIFGVTELINTHHTWQHPVVLSPGRAFDIGPTTSGGKTFRANIYWTERRLPPIEGA